MTKKQTMITTFGGDIYIIKDKNPDEVMEAINAGGDMVRMPNGSWISKRGFADVQSYEDYTFQIEQKQRHKKGQYLKGGQWHDNSGSLGISSDLHKITGEINKKLELPKLKKTNE